MTPTRHERSAIRAMYAGLALTVIATIVPYLDHATGNILAAHIRAGYPTYPQQHIDRAATTWLAYLSVVGVLGIVFWSWAIWATRAGKRWARSYAVVMLLLGAGIALFNLFVRDTSGDTGLPPLLGWVGVLPSVAGVAGVMLLWRRSGPKTRH
jgi:hypothetical protein